MTLAPPRHVVDAGVDRTPPGYAWSDGDVHDYFRPGVPRVLERALGLSHRARIALTLAIGEWIVHRYHRLAGPHHRICLEYIEALWAWSVRWEHTEPFHPDDREWHGPILGPLEVVIVVANDVFERCEEQGDTEQDPAWMAQLAEHVLPDTAAFRVWLDAVLDRLEHHFPWAEDPHDFFLEQDFRGDPVPRELFDPGRPYDPGAREALIDAFVAGLRGQDNPFLRERP